MNAADDSMERTVSQMQAQVTAMTLQMESNTSSLQSQLVDQTSAATAAEARTALSSSISTVLTGLSWIHVGVHSRRALPSPVCALKGPIWC